MSFSPRVLVGPVPSVSWLAPAIRRVAERRDAKLAGELIVELLPAQGVGVYERLTYRLKIAELGVFEVRLQDGQASVQRLDSEHDQAPDRSAPAKLDFVLEGPAAAFSELAAGGAGRRFAGVKISGRRRRARRLLATRRSPLALAELVHAEVRVWPGLLLLALAEAIDPLWTIGSSFVVAFAIDSPAGSNTVIYLRVRDGEPIVVTRVRGDQPQCIVHLSESSFLRMLAGSPLPAGEHLHLQGDASALGRLIGWADRAQGRNAPS